MQIVLPALLFIVFFILKLCGTIAWSWWWITAPLWIASIGGAIIWLAVAFLVTAKDLRGRRNF